MLLPDLLLAFPGSPRCQDRGCSWAVGAFPAWVREGPALCIVSGEFAPHHLALPFSCVRTHRVESSSSAGNIAAAYRVSAAGHWAPVAAGAGRYRDKKGRVN